VAIVVDTSNNEAEGPDSGSAGPDRQESPWRLAAARVRRYLASGKVPDAWCFGVCYGLLLPFFLAPLFATRLLPGLDLPFHIAAADMVAKAGNPASPYAPYYEGGLRIAPYAAHFVALIALGKVMSLLAAHKLIIVLYVAGLPLAMAALLGACRRSRIPALLAFPLAYNLTLHYGFISFALSLPVVLWLLAEMTKLAHTDVRRRFIVRWFVVAAVALLLFLCHLQNFLYGVCAALAFATLARAPWRRKLAAAAALAPAFLGLAYWHFGSPPVAGQAKLTPTLAWRFLKAHRLDDLGRDKLTADLWHRITLIPSHAMRAFTDESNTPACRILCLIIGVYLVAGLSAGTVAWIRARLQERSSPAAAPAPPRMRLAGLIAFTGALCAYLALPHHLQELELMTFFPRFSVLVLLTSLLLVPAGLLRLRGALALALPLPALVFGMLWGRQLYLHYRAYGAEVADFVEVVEKTPPGGKAMGLLFNRKSRVMQVESALIGLPGFYPALRPALGSMVPPTYCGLRHMPCRRKVAADFVTSPWTPTAFSPPKMLAVFDYYFLHSVPGGYDPWPGYHGMFEHLASSGTWSVFRKRPGPIVRDAPPPPPVLPAPPPEPVAPKPLPPAPASRKLALPPARP
jgi:hypothetical protein